MPSIKQRLQLVRRRQQSQWMLRCISIATFGSCLAALMLALARWPVADSVDWQIVVAVMAVGPIVGMLFGIIRARSLRDAAVAIDRTYGLKDRVQTALNFLDKPNPSPLHRLQIDDAEAHLAPIDPKSIPTAHKPRFVLASVVVAIATVVILGLTQTAPKALASVVKNDTVQSVAQQAEEHLKELEAFDENGSDEEISELIRELKEQIKSLKEPGVDPKEAMARLSEMEAALKDMQQKLEKSGQESQLEKIGEALSLSEEMAAAGQAMAKGEMEKAAEELTKLEMPKLDMKTEKAITEKLQQIAQDDKGNGPNKSTQLKEATQQVGEGLGSGNKSKFSEGLKGLAGECEKQGRKKKLTSLLKKQCDCLSECKSECEGECKSEADSKKKGGKNAGKGASGNEAGDKTAKLKTSPKMDLKGQDSGKGDVDIETEESEMKQQEATREYRNKIDKYQALSESVLESESIPLGQRQTIRRYFESIRPQEGEQQAVDQMISPEER